LKHANSLYNDAYEDAEYTQNPETDKNLIDAPLSELGE